MACTCIRFLAAHNLQKFPKVTRHEHEAKTTGNGGQRAEHPRALKTPELKFASESAVKSLEQAITPQVAKIEVIETSHTLRNILIFLAVLSALGGIAFYFSRKKDKPADAPYAGHVPPEPKVVFPTPPDAQPAYVRPVAPVAPVQSAYVNTYTPAPAYQAPVQPTIVNNHYGSSNNGSGDLLTGVLVGEMLANNSNHHIHHDTYVEREVIVECPVYRDTTPTYTAPAYEAPSRSSTWDDTPAPTKSSTWDDTPSKSSSWDDSSSSSSSSSWSDSSSSSSSGGSSDW